MGKHKSIRDQLSIDVRILDVKLHGLRCPACNTRSLFFACDVPYLEIEAENCNRWYSTFFVASSDDSIFTLPNKFLRRNFTHGDICFNCSTIFTYER